MAYASSSPLRGNRALVIVAFLLLSVFTTASIVEKHAAEQLTVPQIEDKLQVRNYCFARYTEEINVGREPIN